MKSNVLIVVSALIIGLSAVISIWLYRDIELRKLSFQTSRLNLINNCIEKVKARYGEVAQKGAGILNNDEIVLLKKESNAEEDLCIKRF